MLDNQQVSFPKNKNENKNKEKDEEKEVEKSAVADIFAVKQFLPIGMNMSRAVISERQCCYGFSFIPE